MVKAVEVKWAEGSRHKVSADVAYSEVERIRAENAGEILPAEVVKAARPKDAPLHVEFEWNNAKAAKAHREEQARSIIRHLVVVRSEVPEAKTRAYETRWLPKTEKKEARKVYQSLDDVLADPVARAQLLKRAYADAVAFLSRYNGLQELSRVFVSIEEFLTEHQIKEPEEPS